MKKLKESKLTLLGLIASIGGAILTLLGGWVSEKKQDQVIEDKVRKVLTEGSQTKE